MSELESFFMHGVHATSNHPLL